MGKYKELIQDLGKEATLFEKAFKDGIYNLPVWYPGERDGQKQYKSDYIEKNGEYMSYGTGDPNGEQTAQIIANTENLERMQKYGTELPEASDAMKDVLESKQKMD